MALHKNYVSSFIYFLKVTFFQIVQPNDDYNGFKDKNLKRFKSCFEELFEDFNKYLKTYDLKTERNAIR